VAAVLMGAEAVEASMGAEAVEASMVAADRMAAHALLAEEVTTKAAPLASDHTQVVTERAAVRTAGLKLAAIPVR
jgi:hypothetical protein